MIPHAATSWTHHPEQITCSLSTLTNDNSNTYGALILIQALGYVLYLIELNLCNNPVKFLSLLFFQMEKERLKEIKCDFFSTDSKGKTQNESLNFLNS